MSTLNNILSAYGSASHKVEGNHVSFEDLAIPQFAEMDTQATQTHHFRNDLIAGTAQHLGEVAKTQFSENEGLEFLTTAVKFGEVQHDVTIHREFTVPVGDEVKTLPMHIVVLSNDSYGEELNKVRDALHAVEAPAEEVCEE